MNGFIIVDPKICSGKPIIKGTRIMVKNILGMVAGGYSVARILEAYPELTRKMVQAALEYAAAVIDEEQVIARAWRYSEYSARPKYCLIIIDNNKIRVRKLR